MNPGSGSKKHLQSASLGITRPISMDGGVWYSRSLADGASTFQAVNWSVMSESFNWPRASTSCQALHPETMHTTNDNVTTALPHPVRFFHPFRHSPPHLVPRLQMIQRQSV